MTVKEEILEMLRNNEPLSEIHGRFRSKSQLFGALTEYLTELTDKVEATRAVLQQTQAELQKASAERERLANERGKLENEVEVLNEKKEALTGDVESLRQEHDQLRSDMAEIRSRGFTPEVIAMHKSVGTPSQGSIIGIQPPIVWSVLILIDRCSWNSRLLAFS